MCGFKNKVAAHTSRTSVWIVKSKSVVVVVVVAVVVVVCFVSLHMDWTEGGPFLMHKTKGNLDLRDVYQKTSDTRSDPFFPIPVFMPITMV